MSPDELKVAIGQALDERGYVDPAMHSKHHAWLETQIERDKARKEMYQKVTVSAISWSVPAILGGVWYWLTHGGQWPQ